MLKEAVYTLACDDRNRELDRGPFSIHRALNGRPQEPGKRGRIVEMASSQFLRDSILSQLRNDHHCLTQQCVHPFMRRDDTKKEL